MKTIKKLLLIILILSLSVSMFTACAEKTQTELFLSSVNDLVKITNSLDKAEKKKLSFYVSSPSTSYSTISGVEDLTSLTATKNQLFIKQDKIDKLLNEIIELNKKIKAEIKDINKNNTVIDEEKLLEISEAEKSIRKINVKLKNTDGKVYKPVKKLKNKMNAKHYDKTLMTLMIAHNEMDNRIENLILAKELILSLA